MWPTIPLLLDKQNADINNERYKTHSMMSILTDLNSNYSSGKFKQIESDLENFFNKNKEAIQDFKNTKLSKLKGVTPTDELAAKLYLLKSRSVNPLEEVKLELEEIEKEIWHRSENGKHVVDRNAVAVEWSKKHAPGWRDQFTMTALYIFGRNKTKYLEIIQDP